MSPPGQPATPPKDPGALRFRRAFLLLLVVAISALFLSVIRPFLISVFLAAILAGVAQPLYRWLVPRLRGKRGPASFVTLLILLLGVGLPLAGFLTVVATQAVNLGEAIVDWASQQAGRLDELIALVQSVPLVGQLVPEPTELAQQLEVLFRRIGPVLGGAVAGAARGTLNFFLQAFILLYGMYYFLVDGPEILRRIMGYMPLSPGEQERLLERFVSVTRATLKGSLFIGVIQGGIAGIAFWVAGVPGAAFWGTVMIVLSIIPAVGAGLVWVPAVIFLFLAGQPVAAVALLAWCAVVVSAIDNFLRPMLIGRDARMSDLLILLSTLGGIILFGAVGFIVGPIVAALFVTTWHIYGEVFGGWLASPEPLVAAPALPAATVMDDWPDPVSPTAEFRGGTSEPPRDTSGDDDPGAR